ncbi:MAG: ACP phosphodiesterase [Halieaceae bacterium]|nr:ACP phosphodiesterase [Halieaceae bacterium]
MNFLAHFHLAWPDGGLLAGGLEGDFYKGPLRGELPEAIERGVRLHRAIDAYTDSHPVVEQLRRDFPPELRRYAGILIDLSFDHFLSVYWSDYSELSLETFNARVYRSLRDQQHSLSGGSRRMLARMVEYDILGLYLDWETVPASAGRIGERFRRGNPLSDVGRQLAPARAMLEQAFLAFYPELQDFSAREERALRETGKTDPPANIALGGKRP